MSCQLPIITCYIFHHLHASSIFYKIFIIKEKTNNKRVAVMIIIKSWLNKLCVCGKKTFVHQSNYKEKWINLWYKSYKSIGLVFLMCICITFQKEEAERTRICVIISSVCHAPENERMIFVSLRLFNLFYFFKTLFFLYIYFISKILNGP